ncbi:MAG TPA: F0F1 ATP synthase subunit delta [Candidatus Saccharimonadales bacterium]|nr:F0F1 ATP synthase subunit delta [Candidatus Saccharimonadales bacterium]
MNSKVSRRVLARTVAAKLLAEPDKKAHWLQALAAYVVEHNMAEDTDLLVNDIAHELYDQGGLLLVSVTSARDLSDGIREDLTRTLQAATGADTVELSEHVNPDLLGGLIAKTPDAQLDASVRTKLKQLASL